MLKGVPSGIAEEIAPHSFEVAILTVLIAEKGKNSGIKINVEKAALMALIHDFPECIIGDINYYTKKAIGGKIKHKMELDAMNNIFPKDSILLGLYEEYSKKESLEAKIVELADKLSTILQAKRYTKLGFDFNDMISNLKEEIKLLLDNIDASFKKIIEELLASFLS